MIRPRRRSWAGVRRSEEQRRQRDRVDRLDRADERGLRGADPSGTRVERLDGDERRDDADADQPARRRRDPAAGGRPGSRAQYTGRRSHHQRGCVAAVVSAIVSPGPPCPAARPRVWPRGRSRPSRSAATRGPAGARVGGIASLRSRRARGAADRAMRGRPTPAGPQPPTETQRQHRDQRRVDVDDQRRERQRHGLEAREVRPPVPDKEDAERERTRTRADPSPAGRAPLRRARNQIHATPAPTGTARPERQPVDPGAIYRLREERAGTERGGGDQDEGDPGPPAAMFGRHPPRLAAGRAPPPGRPVAPPAPRSGRIRR